MARPLSPDWNDPPQASPWRRLGAERLLLVWLLLCLLWAPVPLGSQAGWAQGLLAMAMGLGIAGLATLRWFEGRHPLEMPRPAIWPLGAMLLGAALTPWMSPGLLANRFALDNEAMHVFTLWGAALLTASLVSTPRRVRFVLFGVAAIAVVQGAVVLWMSSQPRELRWFFSTLHAEGPWRGSFAHPAQWASAMALCLAAGTGLWVIARYTRFGTLRRGDTWALALGACTVAALLARHGQAAPPTDASEWPLVAMVGNPAIDLATWLAPGVLSLPRAWRFVRDTTQATKAGIGVSAALALGTLGLHSLVGASPQAPANTLVCVVLLMLLWSPATEAEAVQDGPHLGAAPLRLGLTAGSTRLWDDPVVASDIEQPGS